MPFDPKKLAEIKQKHASKQSFEDISNEPGLQNISLTPLTSPDIKQGGEQAAEAIGARGYPLTGAAIGTGIQMAPDIAMAAFPLGESGEIARPLGKAADIAFAPSIAAGGKALGAAEKAVGVETLPFMSKDLPRNASQAIDLSHMSDYIAKQAPEELAKVMEPAGLNNLRKVYEYTLNTFRDSLPGVNLQAISRAKDILTKALDIAEPSLAGPRAALKAGYQRSDILSAIPKAIGLGAKVAKSSILKGL